MDTAKTAVAATAILTQTTTTMDKRQRKRRQRYIREIEAAEAKAKSPEAVALRVRKAQRKAAREAEREEAERLWARLEEEAWDERCLLEEAMLTAAAVCPDCGERHLTNTEEEALDQIIDDRAKTVAAVHAVYRDGASALFPFLGWATQLSFAFADGERAA